MCLHEFPLWDWEHLRLGSVLISAFISPSGLTHRKCASVLVRQVSERNGRWCNLDYTDWWNSIIAIQISDAIQPSHPLLPSSPLALHLSQHQNLFQWVSSSHQVAKVLECQLQHQSFHWIFRIDFLWDWLVWSPCCPRVNKDKNPSSLWEDRAEMKIKKYDPQTIPPQWIICPFIFTPPYTGHGTTDWFQIGKGVC